MLILTRYPQQSIVIEGGITITVLSVTGRQVRIGIDAPKEVNIVRDELLDPNHKSNKKKE